MYGKELRNYLEELSHFRRIIEQIKGELLYAGLPLSEIFYNIASGGKEPYENWMMDVAFQCQGTQEKRFADLWTDTIEKDLPELKWRGKMNPLICEPGELLEIGDREGVVRLLEYHLKRLDMEIEKRTAETSEKKKLDSWRGAAGGICLVILLLYKGGNERERRENVSINLIFKIAAVGILVSILSQVLKHSGREEQAFLTSLAGLILVLSWVLPAIYDLFSSIRQLFSL